MDKYPDALSIFLVPPSLDELEARLRNRGIEKEEILQKRLKKASEEMKYLDKFDYIVTNDDLNKAVESVKALIMSARLVDLNLNDKVNF
jgi:guanylate kinase